MKGKTDPDPHVIHSVLFDIGFLNLAVSKNVIFNEACDQIEFYQLIYQLIHSTINKLPIQQLYIPGRDSSWLPDLSMQDQNSIWRFDVFQTDLSWCDPNMCCDSNHRARPRRAYGLHQSTRVPNLSTSKFCC